LNGVAWPSYRYAWQHRLDHSVDQDDDDENDRGGYEIGFEFAHGDEGRKAR
jgi:hypothetical protein